MTKRKITVTPAMVEAAMKILTRYKGPNVEPTRDPRSIGSKEVRRAIEAALSADTND